MEVIDPIVEGFQQILLRIRVLENPPTPKTKNKLPLADTPSDLRLQRFLLTGTETPKYFPGSWESRDYFVQEKVTCVADYVKDITTAQDFINALQSAKNVYPHGSPCIFALALAIKSVQGDPDEVFKIRSLLYTAANSIVKDNADFLTFMFHLNSLKIGTAKAWRKFVEKWYKSKPPHELALEISKLQGKRGWKHKDIIKLAHVKVEESNIALRCVLHYVTHDYKDANAKYSASPEASKVLSTLKTVEDLKHCEDPAHAAKLIVENDILTLDHVPSHFLTNGQVWTALLTKIPPSLILNSLESLHRSQLLGDEMADGTKLSALKLTNSNASDISGCVVSALEKVTVSPTLAYITLQNYSSGGRPVKREFQEHVTNDMNKKMKTVLLAKSAYPRHLSKTALRSWQKRKRTGVVLPPSPPVVGVLLDLVQRSLLAPNPEHREQARLLVTLDMRDHMFKGFQQCRLERKRAAEGNADTGKHRHYFADCFYNRNIRPGNAAILLALELSSMFTEVTVAVFNDDDIQVVPVWKDNKLLTMEKAEEELKKAKIGRASPCSPIDWAVAQQKEIDLFVNLLDMSSRVREFPKKERPMHNAQNSLYKYQEAMKMPDSGLVTVSLAGFKGVTTDITGRRVLDIIGFDEFTTKVIKEFTTTAKKKL